MGRGTIWWVLTGRRSKKRSQFAGLSFSSTLDGFDLLVTIKIVEKRKTLFGARLSRASARQSDLRPYTLRVVRDHEGGLWTLEDNSGQLYLAVLSREVSEHKRERARAHSPRHEYVEAPRGL